MIRATLLVAALVALTAGAVYAFVGVRLRARRTIGEDAQRAMRSFSAWWLLLSANVLTASAFYAAAAFGFTSFEAQLTYAHAQRLLLAASLVGLLHYLTYLFTGRDLLVPIAIFYAAYYGLLEYTLLSANPTGVFVGDWRTDLAYAETSAGRNPLRLLSAAMLILPPVVGALAYFRLYFRVKSRTQRYRIALVSWSLVAWWIVAVIAGQREALGQEGFQLVNRFLGLAAALVILAAYLPPAAVRRRLGVAAYPDSA